MTDSKNQKPQLDRFIETARELECDEDAGRFNETLSRVSNPIYSRRVDYIG